MNRSLKVRGTQWAVLGAAGVGLEVIPRLGVGDAITFSPLSAIVARGWELVISGELNTHLMATGGALVISFALAAIVGVPLGWLLWRLPRLKRVLDPYLTAYYAIPIFAFYPVLLTILGFNLWPIITIAWAWSVVAVLLNSAIGFATVPDVLIKVGKSLSLSRRQVFTRIVLHAAGPYVFTGLKLGVVYALIGVIASEFILSTRGLGYLVSNNYVNFRTTDMYVAMYMVLALAAFLNLGLTSLERRLYGHRT